MAKTQTITVTTDAAEDATVYSGPVHGRILMVKYTKTDFADGVDFDVTTETTEQNVWIEDDVNASKVVYPRQNIHDANDGSEITYDGTNEVYDHIWAVYERIKIVVDAGGATKTGTFIVMTDE
jgi:hypothetical protein